jgi:hypothetical protein
MEALQQYREAARLVDEVDGAAFERRFLIDVVAEHGEKDDRRRCASAAQAAQHLETVHPGHAPVQQDDLGAAAALEVVERRLAAREAQDVEALVDKVEAERFAEGIVVVNEDDPNRRRTRHGHAAR